VCAIFSCVLRSL